MSERALVEVQIRAMITQPGRLYDLIHALVEESYRQAEYGNPLDTVVWRRLAIVLTTAEEIAQTLD